MSIWRKLQHVLSGGNETQPKSPSQDRQLRNHRITLEPLEERRLLSAVAFFQDTLDSDPGWVGEERWAFGTPTGTDTPPNGNPDPSGGYTGSNVYGVEIDGNYWKQAGGPFYLTTSAIDTTGYENTQLDFYRWLNTASSSDVTATIEVHDGSTWQNIYTNPSDVPVTDNAWYHAQYDISAYADNRSTVQVRWGYQKLSNNVPVYSGWNIDDVSIMGTPIPGEIHGTVWNDYDANGTADSGEPAWAGATVFLDTNGDGLLNVDESSTVTAGDGSYSFTELAAETYNLEIDAPDGWSTTAGPGAVTLGLAEVVSGKDFGLNDVEAPTVTASVASSTNDTTPEVTVTATDNDALPDGTAVAIDVDLTGDGDFVDAGETDYASSTLTAGTALIELTPALADGTYDLRARVSDPTGNEGISATVATTVTSVTEIHGTKWNDLDGDGEWDQASEPGLEGWTIYIDENGNSQWDGAGVEDFYDVTGTDGSYSIGPLTSGTYMVREVPQSGWTQTFPYDFADGIERVGVAADGTEGNDMGEHSVVSDSGRYVIFGSRATNLVSDDTNDSEDIFLYDRTVETLERISVAADGTEGDWTSTHPTISSDGRYVLFGSVASNLVPDDTNGEQDVFLYDSVADTIERLSVAYDGSEGDGTSAYATITPDGRYVVFESTATNLVPDDTNNRTDVFVKDTQTGAIACVSRSASGAEADQTSFYPEISADGQYISFTSYATRSVVKPRCNPDGNRRSQHDKRRRCGRVRLRRRHVRDRDLSSRLRHPRCHQFRCSDCSSG